MLFACRLRDHTNYVNCVRFSPDASKLVSVSSDKTALLFDGKTGARTGAFDSTGGHTGSIYAAAWSPDGKQVGRWERKKARQGRRGGGEERERRRGKGK